MTSGVVLAAETLQKTYAFGPVISGSRLGHRWRLVITQRRRGANVFRQAYRVEMAQRGFRVRDVSRVERSLLWCDAPRPVKLRSSAK